MKIGIIGGAGHVGLPFGLVLADTGFSVTPIDKDRASLNTIESGEVPFTESGVEEYLADALDAGLLECTTDFKTVADCDAVVFVVGTPIDEHHNPQMSGLLDLVNDVADHLVADQLVLFRSTVYPGTTRVICERLSERGFNIGQDLFIAFTPERIAQHHAFEEIVSLPQLIGAPDDESYERAVALFENFLTAECHRLTPTEAELGKLFTNMWRYLTFAAANEFFLITDSFAEYHDVNVHRILEQTGRNYPRFDVPSPGANVGGPCLTKDGWFLVDNIPYNELVSAAYQINEGMPSQFVDRMARAAPDPEKIAVLGITFKQNSDDTRNSVAFKLEKQIHMKGYTNVVKIEPNVPGFDDLDRIEGSDWVTLMTPHDEFYDFTDVADRVNNTDCLYCDVWGTWGPTIDSDNGFFRGADTVTAAEREGETESVHAEGGR